MKGLTIVQAQQYAGYSRPTWLKWLDDGTVGGEKGNGATDTWFIKSEDVERIRLEAIEKLQKQIKEISTPVPKETT